MWRMSGIFRDVYMTAHGHSYIRDAWVETVFDGAYEDAMLKLHAEVASSESGEARVVAELYDAQWNPVSAGDFTAGLKLGIAAVDETLRVKAPLKWTAETPYLYTLLLHLYSNEGEALEALETMRVNVGFREVKIDGVELKVNGVPVKIRGVNRHDTNCDTGHAVSLDDMVKDITLMKRHNVNAVRTSHYPNDPRWLDLCDQYGLFVIDEADLECHGAQLAGGFATLSDNPEWEAAYLDRAERMVRRDRNHPSVILCRSATNPAGAGTTWRWSNGSRRTTPRAPCITRAGMMRRNWIS
jgi:beta-galactosidase/beta-glucuronidase